MNGKEDHSEGKGNKILWSADDVHECSFTVKNAQRATTVAEYFRDRYGITLRYPKMPIVYIYKVRKQGGVWLPIEFVFQAFAKSKENSNEMVKNVLKYHVST